MRKVIYKAHPFNKEDVTLALESGVDGLLVPQKYVESVSSLARCPVVSLESLFSCKLEAKEDELKAADAMAAGKLVELLEGWEIIPVENLLAKAQADARKKSSDEGIEGLALEVVSADQARLAIEILEEGVDIVIVPQRSISCIKDIVDIVKYEAGSIGLVEAVITEIRPVGMGHRVCVDTLSLLQSGQGMLVGNSAAFTFLVNAETERNEYVASRPFRINAGAVHAYALMPNDTTTYLEEIRSGKEVLFVDHTGKTSVGVVGRVKIERRPMLLIRAQSDKAEGAVFLQNAETIRLVTASGTPKSVVDLKVGDVVLCHLDTAGRHFGMRINEEIAEV